MTSALFGISSIANNRQQPGKQFALMMKATGPEFVQKAQQPEGLRLIDEHFKQLQTLTQQGICIFAGRSIRTKLLLVSSPCAPIPRQRLERLSKTMRWSKQDSFEVQCFHST